MNDRGPNQNAASLTPDGRQPAPAGSGSRPQARSRRIRRGSESAVLTLAFLGILVLINILVGRAGWQADLSAEGRFTLSPQSIQVVNSLPAPVQVTAFVRDGSSGLLADLLRQYDRVSSSFQLRLVDPVKEPSVARQYEVTQYDTIVLELGGRSRRVEPANLYSYGTSQSQLEFRGEQAITRALVELAREQSMKVYFLTGHGELTPADRLGTLASYLEGEGYTVGSLNVAQAGSIPEDATVLVAVGPQSDLSQQERETIEAYLEQGGRLMLLMDPSTRSITGWNTLAEGLGVRFRNDVVVDPTQSFFLDPLSPMPTLRYHDITKDLQERQMRVMLPRARSLERLDGDQAAYRVTTLLESSFDAWGETTLQGTTLRKDEADTAGPLALAVAVTRPVVPVTSGADESSPEEDEAQEGAQTTTAQEPVAVVLGNASFVDGQMLGIQGNQDFFLNALNWLVGEEHLISIRPKVLGTPTVQLTPALIRQVFYGFVVVLPLAVLLAGGVVWWRRRAL